VTPPDHAQARIAAICVEAGIALYGPNCMGILNPHHKSTTYLQELREPAGLAGNVAIPSHSGGLCVGLLTDTRRFGFGHIVSSGNEATVSAAAFLEYLLEHGRDHHMRPIILNRVATALHDRQPALRRERSRFCAWTSCRRLDASCAEGCW
jgi:acyl-CoA synthetase (NDP forming)